MKLTFHRETCLAWLASAELSPETLMDIFEHEQEPVRVYESFAAQGKLPGDIPLNGRIRQLLLHNSADRVMHEFARHIEQHEIKAITAFDSSYPQKLIGIPDAPIILFYQGKLSALNSRTVSIVGSRNASYKGMEATEKISEKLSNHGVAIVSGLAYGIDSASHQGCLKGNSPTVAVLGCGLDQNYPAENAGLRRSILQQGGLILSEYAPGDKPLARHFPWRNRIISGLGDCVILMEARIRSGSMTTVQHALNQGKDVFVYPGEPGNPKYEGNHQLLREGAIYFTSAEDLLEDMGWLDKKPDVRQNTKETQALLQQLTPTEAKVLQVLENEEMSFDRLCLITGLPASELNAALSLLQIYGLIQPMPGKTYCRTQEK